MYFFNCPTSVSPTSSTSVSRAHGENDLNRKIRSKSSGPIHAAWARDQRSNQSLLRKWASDEVSMVLLVQGDLVEAPYRNELFFSDKQLFGLLLLFTSDHCDTSAVELTSNFFRDHMINVSDLFKFGYWKSYKYITYTYSSLTHQLMTFWRVCQLMKCALYFSCQRPPFQWFVCPAH